jgi:hypothetical protein
MRMLFVQLAPREVTARRVAAREARFKWKMAAAREADTGVAFACAVTWSLVRLLLVQLINMPLLLFVQLAPNERARFKGENGCCS